MKALIFNKSLKLKLELCPVHPAFLMLLFGFARFQDVVELNQLIVGVYILPDAAILNPMHPSFASGTIAYLFETVQWIAQL